MLNEHLLNMDLDFDCYTKKDMFDLQQMMPIVINNLESIECDQEIYFKYISLDIKL